MAWKVAACLLYAVDDGSHLVEGVPAEFRHARVARDAVGCEPEDAPSPLPYAEGEVRRLSEDAGVQPQAPILDELPRGDPLVGLLVNDAGNKDFASNPGGRASVDHRCEGAFHVNRSTAIEETINHRGCVWVVTPALPSARVNVVHVAVEKDDLAVAVTEPSQDAAHIVDLDLVAEAFHLLCDKVCKLSLVAGEARRLNKLHQKFEHLVIVVLYLSKILVESIHQWSARSQPMSLPYLSTSCLRIRVLEMGLPSSARTILMQKMRRGLLPFAALSLLISSALGSVSSLTTIPSMS